MSSDPWGFDGMNRHSILYATFWGDSLTFGTGASGAAGSMPGQVSMACGNRPYNNEGIGGQSSTQILDRLLLGTPQQLSVTTVIWAGRGNYLSTSQVQSDIASMVAFLGHTRYLVVGLFNGTDPSLYAGTSDYIQMQALNSALSATYGSRFVDTQTPLVAAGSPTGSNPDPTNYALGIPPAAIMFDTVHLVDAGYTIVANQISPLITSNGW